MIGARTHSPSWRMSFPGGLEADDVFLAAIRRVGAALFLAVFLVGVAAVPSVRRTGLAGDGWPRSCFTTRAVPPARASTGHSMSPAAPSPRAASVTAIVGVD